MYQVLQLYFVIKYLLNCVLSSYLIATKSCWKMTSLLDIKFWQEYADVYTMPDAPSLMFTGNKKPKLQNKAQMALRRISFFND